MTWVLFALISTVYKDRLAHDTKLFISDLNLRESLISFFSILTHFCFLQVEQLTTELSMERSLSQKLDAEKQAMERANRELKNKVSELETAAQTRSRAQIAALEAKIQYLEEQYNSESQERANATRQVNISQC